jgi:hypothetical protein
MVHRSRTGKRETDKDDVNDDEDDYEDRHPDERAP